MTRCSLSSVTVTNRRRRPISAVSPRRRGVRKRLYPKGCPPFPSAVPYIPGAMPLPMSGWVPATLDGTFIADLSAFLKAHI